MLPAAPGGIDLAQVPRELQRSTHPAQDDADRLSHGHRRDRHTGGEKAVLDRDASFQNVLDGFAHDARSSRCMAVAAHELMPQLLASDESNRDNAGGSPSVKILKPVRRYRRSAMKKAAAISRGGF
jgi:hypothetical protein